MREIKAAEFTTNTSIVNAQKQSTVVTITWTAVRSGKDPSRIHRYLSWLTRTTIEAGLASLPPDQAQLFKGMDVTRGKKYLCYSDPDTVAADKQRILRIARIWVNNQGTVGVVPYEYEFIMEDARHLGITHAMAAARYAEARAHIRTEILGLPLN